MITNSNRWTQTFTRTRSSYRTGLKFTTRSCSLGEFWNQGGHHRPRSDQLSYQWSSGSMAEAVLSNSVKTTSRPKGSSLKLVLVDD